MTRRDYAFIALMLWFILVVWACAFNLLGDEEEEQYHSPWQRSRIENNE